MRKCCDVYTSAAIVNISLIKNLKNLFRVIIHTKQCAEKLLTGRREGRRERGRQCASNKNVRIYTLKPISVIMLL